MFGAYVSSVKIRVVNLQDVQVRQRLVKSATACSVGLYAMSVVAEPVAAQPLDNIMAKVLRIDDEGTRQDVLLQTMKYLNSYHQGLTIKDWQAIEIRQTGQSKMVDVAMELAEVFREEGRQEERAATAKKMLEAGYRLDQILKFCDLSDEQIGRLRSQ